MDTLIEVAESFADPRYAAVDCTGFIDVYVRHILELRGITVPKDFSRRVNLAALGADLDDPKKKSAAREKIMSGDSSTAGVVQMLLSPAEFTGSDGKQLTRLGTRQSLASAKPGDIVQWWSKSRVEGHAEVLISIDKRKDGKYSVRTFGSHRSKKGIAMKTTVYNPNRTNFHIVRID